MLKHLCKAFGSFSKVHDNVPPPLCDLLFIWFIIAASRLVLLRELNRLNLKIESLLIYTNYSIVGI